MTLEIMDRVIVKGINEKGVILSIHHQIGKTEYQVRYFFDGKPETVYYHDFELEKIK